MATFRGVGLDVLPLRNTQDWAWLHPAVAQRMRCVGTRELDTYTRCHSGTPTTSRNVPRGVSADGMHSTVPIAMAAGQTELPTGKRVRALLRRHDPDGLAPLSVGWGCGCPSDVVQGTTHKDISPPRNIVRTYLSWAKVATIPLQSAYDDPRP